MLDTLIRGARVRGPAATFNVYDMVECILVLGDKGSVGRGRLGEELMLGPGAVRTLISRLKRRGYITVDRGGCRLTSKGVSVYSDLTSRFTFRASLKCWDKALGRECFAICVSGAAQASVNAVNLRDVAVKAGANGALILTYSKGEFYFAGEEISYEKTQPSGFLNQIKSHHRFNEGDILIIGFADEKRYALHGSLAAALSLITVGE
jgi:hypothetical protein